eukprot:Nitzschia sp. Nitz4//scaffold177_size45885//553//1050//NITZ4_007199-RA/size45885-protein2genome-gene-0.10-mRNA-1//1//CDS//3329539037//411//frame0
MQRQRRKDARIVRSVLKASENHDHYAVLGIRNWNLFIPAQTLQWGEHVWTIIPRTCLRKTTAKDIRKAYRTRALEVHPDKNQDERAQEAFLAVEQAASILSDEPKKKVYDEGWRRQVSIRRREQKEMVTMILRKLVDNTRQAYNVAHSIVGPFTIPLLILGVLVF